MAPMANIVGKQREICSPDRDSQQLFPYQVQRPPRITYGKKKTALLPLTANHFRRDVYAIPSDDESEVRVRQDQNILPASGTDIPSDDLRLVRREPLPSARSIEDQRQVTPTRNVQRKSNPQRNHAVSRSLGSSARGTGNASRSAKRAEAKSARSAGGPRQDRITTHDRHKISKRQNAGESRRRHSAKRASTPKRRLPVNELILIHSPLGLDRSLASPEDWAADHPPDPIEDMSGSIREHNSPRSIAGYRERRTKHLEAPLSAIRKRLKPSKRHEKSLQPVRKSVTELRAGMNDSFLHRGRDGFEDSELAVRPQKKRKKKTSVANEGLVVGFESLQLNIGPLPDVKFEASETELKIELPSPNATAHPTVYVDDGHFPAGNSDAVLNRQTSVKRRAKDQLIRAELSSISAPERLSSDSEDSDEEHHAESLQNYVDEDKFATDSDLAAEFNQPIRPSSIRVVDTPLDQHYDLPSHQEHPRKYLVEHKENRGVTLDFRLPSLPGQLPKQPLGKRHLIEVNEPIVEVKESEMPPTAELFYTDRTDRASRGFSTVLPRHHRHRSILKNSTSAEPTRTTRRESTAANTRRNTLVYASESRYFANASDILDGLDQPAHRIVPRRPSYFARSGIEIPDSGRIVPETSSAYFDHINRGGIRTIQQDSALSRPPELPTVPRHLETLTSTVSMEQRAIDQSSRRISQNSTRVI